jgi:hypothetical protein
MGCCCAIQQMRCWWAMHHLCRRRLLCLRVRLDQASARLRSVYEARRGMVWRVGACQVAGRGVTWFVAYSLLWQTRHATLCLPACGKTGSTVTRLLIISAAGAALIALCVFQTWTCQQACTACCDVLCRWVPACGYASQCAHHADVVCTGSF